jgi:Predicted transcriptional regulators
MRKKIKELRLKHHLTQEQVADALGFTRSAYTKFETGASELSFARAILIANLFSITLDELANKSSY